MSDLIRVTILMLKEERNALLDALEPLTDAASKQLPQGPDHDGLANCDLLAQARAAIAKAKEGT